MLATYGDEDFSQDEMTTVAEKFVNQRFEADIDGDGVVDDALPEDHTVFDDVFEKYYGMWGDFDAQQNQLSKSCAAVAEYFSYNHNRMQSLINDMVDIAAADGYIDDLEEQMINMIAENWGCSANISYNAGVPVILFVW
jgi:hypothetical protein|tara:strand:- start:116 stop:532 length:417 start_codon:yes stop_codon:yes gene_type:complete